MRAVVECPRCESLFSIEADMAITNVLCHACGAHLDVVSGQMLGPLAVTTVALVTPKETA